MTLYKFDTHVHTSETSPCGSISSRDVIHIYKKAGYAGVVITDHYYKRFFETLQDANWEEKIDAYLKGYKNALIEGERLGLKVFLGMEICFEESPNDYLVYGVDEAFLKEHKELYKLGLEKFKEFIKDKNLLIFQAHPFRTGLTPAPPQLLDGVEAFNGNRRHNSRNSKALEFGNENNLTLISGSDFHELEDLARGGIVIEEAVATPEEFLQVLKENRISRLITST